jgi:hypothetical protein
MIGNQNAGYFEEGTTWNYTFYARSLKSSANIIEFECRPKSHGFGGRKITVGQFETFSAKTFFEFII